MEKMGNRLNLRSENGFDGSSARSVSDVDAQSDRSARSTQSSPSGRYVTAFSRTSKRAFFLTLLSNNERLKTIIRS